MKKRVQPHILEKTIGTLMILLGAVALYLFFTTLRTAELATEVAIIQILIIIVLAILAQTIVLIRIYEKVE